MLERVSEEKDLGGGPAGQRLSTALLKQRPTAHRARLSHPHHRTGRTADSRLAARSRSPITCRGAGRGHVSAGGRAGGKMAAEREPPPMGEARPAELEELEDGEDLFTSTVSTLEVRTRPLPAQRCLSLRYAARPCRGSGSSSRP